MSCHFRDLFTSRIVLLKDPLNPRGTSTAFLDLVIQKCQVWLSCYAMLLDEIFIPLKDMCIIDSTPIQKLFQFIFFQKSPYSELFSYHSSKFVFFLFTFCWRKPHIRILWVDDYFPTSVSVGYVWSFPYSTPGPLPFVPQGPMEKMEVFWG